MPRVTTKNEFIKELEKFTTTNKNTKKEDTNLTLTFVNNKIIIEETEENGRGEIYLDISSSSECFFVKINHKSVHNIGLKSNHNDGIVLKINLATSTISVFLFELKKQLRFKNLETAVTQLAGAYRFIKYLNLEECFNIDYKFFIVYETNSIARDVGILKISTRFQSSLFNAIHENKDELPLQVPLCIYKKYPFQQVKFGETIVI